MSQMNKIKLPKRIRNHVNPLADRTEIKFGGFTDNRPIMIDIGAYRGEFSMQLVEKFSDSHNFIVTEIRKPYANYLRELFVDNHNVAVFDGDSAKNISGLLKKSIENGTLVEYIFINFPDPWFKEKHKKRRVLNSQFLSDLYSIVPNSDTKIIFQTDQKPLFDETVELIENDGQWDIEYFDEPLWNIQSYWEKMKLSEGDSVNRMILSKK